MVPNFQFSTASFSFSLPDLNASKLPPCYGSHKITYLSKLSVASYITRKSKLRRICTRLLLLPNLTFSLSLFNYQKDERTLLGNLVTIRCSFSFINKMSFTFPRNFLFVPTLLITFLTLVSSSRCRKLRMRGAFEK
jgi:hypothetical protein